MKITAGEVFVAYQAAQTLAKEKLPVKGAYWVARLIRKLDSEYAVVEAQRTELVRKHGVENEGIVHVPPENNDAFTKDFTQVLLSEIDIECPKIKLEMLGDGSIDVGVLFNLDKFIEE